MKTKFRIMKHGLRNFLVVAPMPTASTARIHSNNESYGAVPTAAFALFGGRLYGIATDTFTGIVQVARRL